MKSLSPTHLALLLPSTILIHQLEEYYGHFPIWYSELLNAQLSDQDFIWINGVGLLIFILGAVTYIFNKNNMILVALGTLVFANGLIHLIMTIFTLSYSPGVISGVVLFIPLGIIIFKKIMPQLNMGERTIAISIGILVLLTVSMVASSI